MVDQVPRVLQTHATAVEMLEAASLLAPDGLRAIVVLTNQSSTDRGARQAFSEVTEGYVCIALVVKSRVSEVTGNFFLRLNGPKCPMRLFKNVDDASEWAVGLLAAAKAS
jgi:hypothetical protein